ncbi:hypothetical protein GCM10010347_10590 [Streptomyces cirratus]|uniref:Uncharacterized protein n=2 Tax=Streptomyces cirratus TaxID=68187 RepID=A0ABQ3ESN8_9ACTN|nr:hypothetical protein GCM10010347_10590 [Streptomyces cirratus]
MEILHDSEIVLVSEDGCLLGRVEAGFSAASYAVRISDRDEVVEHVAWNLFEALAKVRTDLQQAGLKPAVEGACRDVYPSRMALEMGGGRKAYRWPVTDRPVTVGIFDPVPSSEYGRLAYVEEQRVSVDRLRSEGSG